MLNNVLLAVVERYHFIAAQADLQLGWWGTLPGLLKGFAWLYLLWRMWGQPAVVLLPAWVAPLGRWLAWPHGSRLSAVGGVSIVAWLTLSQRVATVLARTALQAR